MQYLKDPLIIESSIFYHLRRENGSAEAWRKRGGRSAEAQPFRPWRAETRRIVVECSPKQLAQTLTGVPTYLCESELYVRMS